MTKLLVDKVLNQADLLGLADTCGDHAAALEDIWERAGLLGAPVQEAQTALANAKGKLELLAQLIDQHVKDAKVVAL